MPWHCSMSLIRNDIPALLVHFLVPALPVSRPGENFQPGQQDLSPCAGRGPLLFGMGLDRRPAMLLIPNHIPGLLVKIQVALSELAFTPEVPRRSSHADIESRTSPAACPLLCGDRWTFVRCTDWRRLARWPWSVVCASLGMTCHPERSEGSACLRAWAPLVRQIQVWGFLSHVGGLSASYNIL